MNQTAVNFKAKWIAPKGVDYEKNLYFYARTSCFLKEDKGQRRLYIAAGCAYTLFVNGRQITAGPARGNKTTLFYDSLEVGDLLKSGENHIGFLVFCPNLHNHVCSPVGPGLFAQLENGDELASNADWEVNIADEWEQDSEPWAHKFGLVECRDFRKTPKGWATFGDNANWQKASVVSKKTDFCGKKLLPRDIPFLKENRYLPASIARTAYVPPLNNDNLNDTIGELLHNEPHQVFAPDGQWRNLLLEGESLLLPHDETKEDVAVIVDYEKEISGGFSLDITAPSGVVVDVCYCDFLLDNGRMKVSHFSPNSHHYCARFITNEGRQQIEDARRQMGYRYFQLVFRNVSEPIRIHSLKAVDIRYPYSSGSSFLCSDFRLNKIWETCLETISVCTNDTFMDCPWRERALWVNDMIVTGLTAIQGFGDARIVKRCLKLAHGDRQAHNLVPAIVPSTPLDKHILVPTCLYFLLELRDYWMHSGDAETLNEILPAIEKNYKFFEEWEDEHCHLTPPEKYWNFFEWSYESCDISLDGKNTANLNWLYAWCLRVLSELLDLNGEGKKAKYYASKIPKIVEGMKNHFKVEGEKYYADWLEEDGSQSKLASQLSHALAILSGALPEAEAKEFGEKILFDNKFHETELFMSHFQFLATEKVGREEEALEKIRRLWGMIVDAGSPVIWENAVYEIGPDFASGSGSLSHAFSTAPVSFFQRTILGVKPLKPGFKKFSVDPRPLGLEFANGRVPTPNGNIHVAWKNTDEKLEVELTVPVGLIASTAIGNLENGKHKFEIALKRKIR